VAQQILDSCLAGISLADWFALEDALWTSQPMVEIPGRVRRAVARELNLDDLVFQAGRFERLLEQLWVLDTDPLTTFFTGSQNSLRAQIDRHVLRNKDWSVEELFEQLGAFETGRHARFSRFLEGIVSPEAMPDPPTQRRIAEYINTALGEAGARLEETELRDGYPAFHLVATRLGMGRRPKNLIFASFQKPDIRFLDAVDNAIEVLGGADEVLVYDRPIGPEGICWKDLQRWWQDTQDISDESAAKRSLYNRLKACLPSEETSPQRNLFALYHEIHGPRVQMLPALLPEVWLHWDHKTVRQRGRDALTHFRMDFLLLLPHGRRVVLEVDGAHHYENSSAYAATVRGDRDLKLSGYDVFRFGSTELSDMHRARPALQAFFAEVFDAYEVSVPSLE
jgi:very-short-patch-repair endonuclease